jgi:hypothetical protein
MPHSPTQALSPTSPSATCPNCSKTLFVSTSSSPAGHLYSQRPSSSPARTSSSLSVSTSSLPAGHLYSQRPSSSPARTSSSLSVSTSSLPAGHLYSQRPSPSTYSPVCADRNKWPLDTGDSDIDHSILMSDLLRFVDLSHS